MPPQQPPPEMAPQVVVHDHDPPDAAAPAQPPPQPPPQMGLGTGATALLVLFLTAAYLAWDAQRRRQRRQEDRLHPARRERLEAEERARQKRAVRRVVELN